ncbi:MAG: hypothetical protein ACQESF_07205 [Nanobdellota archaeon]
MLFSYENTSCYRNHDRYTLCAMHHHENHEGDWKDCKECRDLISETEMYVWYGTNEYNFEKLPNPPSFEPTKCSKCKRVIKLAEETVMYSGGEYICINCVELE